MSNTDLTQVLADAREEAQVLRRNGASFAVERVERLLSDVAEATEEWTTWLSEGDAIVRSGFSLDWFRGRFASLERDGHARMTGRARQYRACAVPRRANTALASARGRDAARASRKSA